MLETIPCPFCGQHIILSEPIADDADLIARKEAAAAVCNCSESQAVAYAMSQIQEGEYSVEHLMGNIKLTEQVKPFVRLIRYGAADKMSVTYTDGDTEVKVSISVTAKGKIKVEQKRTVKEVVES